jgi:acetolactate synthase-1/2/3 large subunit
MTESKSNDAIAERVRGGVILARALAQKNIGKVFTLSGGFINPVLEGLLGCGLATVNTPHEQVAGHMADAWARVTREPAVCLVGPEGFANAVPAMLEAFGERSPVIFITGSSTLRRRGAGGFKEIDDVHIAQPLTKLSLLVTDGRRIPEFVNRAYQSAVNGVPGPVHLSVPTDILYSSYDVAEAWGERPFDHAPRPPRRAWPAPDALSYLVHLFKKASRPLVIAGQGASWANAGAALSRLANGRNVPVLNSPYHPKILNGDDPAYMGLADVHLYPPARFALENSDLIVLVGCRLDNLLNFGNAPLFPSDVTTVVVNGSGDELAENHAASEQVLGDPRAVLEELENALAVDRYRADPEWLPANTQQRNAWIERTRDKLRRDESNLEGGGLHQLRLSATLLEALRPGDWLVVDGGDTHFWAEIALLLARKRLGGVLHPGPFSLMGVGVSFAMTAKLRHPDANVVLLTGDGAFLNGGLSIEVAFQERLPITVVVDNNSGLGSISQQQMRLFGQTFKTGFRDIPFHNLVAGLGGYGEQVTNRDELMPALERAFRSEQPSCVNVKTHSMASPLIEALTDRRAKASIE